MSSEYFEHQFGVPRVYFFPPYYFGIYSIRDSLRKCRIARISPFCAAYSHFWIARDGELVLPDSGNYGKSVSLFDYFYTSLRNLS